MTIKQQAANAMSHDATFFQQLRVMRRVLATSSLRKLLLGLAAGIAAVIVATAYGQVILNQWNKPFYDALERRDLNAFMHQLLVFLYIAGVLLALNVAQAWMNQFMHIKLRQSLVTDLIDEWMRPGRALRLSNAGAIGQNPDQRMHEDARHLADLSTDLGIGLLQASILLVSFIGVLWAISEGFAFQIGERSVAIPGYMVWAAILYAGVASWISWLAGRPLIKLNSERYALEAELRVALMRTNERIDDIAKAKGESAAREKLRGDLMTVLAATRRIMTAAVRLTWFTAGYGWITVVAPIVIASPVYFSGTLSFGGLMMAAAAFTQVHASLKWFVDNIGSIADWRATLLRVTSFRLALVESDGKSDDGPAAHPASAPQPAE